MKDQEILAVLHEITGMQWTWAEGDVAAMRSVGIHLEGKWQLMPITDEAGGAFWDWHLVNNRQWFNDKREAALYLMKCWKWAIDTGVDIRDRYDSR